MTKDIKMERAELLREHVRLIRALATKAKIDDILENIVQSGELKEIAKSVIAGTKDSTLEQRIRTMIGSRNVDQKNSRPAADHGQGTERPQSLPVVPD